MTKTLVTGGSGYFGEVMVTRLLERGDSVRVLDLVENEDHPKEAEVVRGDVRDREEVRRAMHGVEVVHHCVAQVPLAKDKEKFWSVNVDGTRTVLEEALRAGARKVVLVSSSAVYGVPERNPVTTETEPRPREAYGEAKLTADRQAKSIISQGLAVDIVRPRTILGHGRLGIFQILFEWVRKGRPLYLMGRGNNRYQFVHADDLAAACLLADRRTDSGLYLCGTDRFGSMRELLEGLVDHAGTESPVRSLPMKPMVFGMKLTSKLGLSPLGDYHSLMYGREMYFDLESTKQALGWTPEYSNLEMITESYDFYIQHREEILSRKDASHHRSAVKLGILKAFDYLP
jgi:nucleoside-diphosphate-sugar epimerase